MQHLFRIFFAHQRSCLFIQRKFQSAQSSPPLKDSTVAGPFTAGPHCCRTQIDLMSHLNARPPPTIQIWAGHGVEVNSSPPRARQRCPKPITISLVTFVAPAAQLSQIKSMPYFHLPY